MSGRLRRRLGRLSREIIKLMTAWIVFWGIALVVAGVSFLCITLVVAWKGYGDLKSMFFDLRKQQKQRHEL